ncbi:MAG TPA: hypothetical protein VJL29_06810 [Thermoguttaceae bacterium]|nr:hypothetical protein [Thermoguttaceae bacterium]
MSMTRILYWSVGMIILTTTIGMNGSWESSSGKGVPKQPAKEIASATWTEIKNAKSDISIHDDPIEYWSEMLVHCRIPFGNMIHQADNPSEAIRYFVDQFGKHGAEADIRWMWVGRGLITPFKSRPPDRGVRLFPFTVKIKMELSEHIARRCLRDREFLERYYQAILWSRSLLRNGRTPDSLSFAIELMGEGFAEEEGRWYWWYARNLILLAHAFGRDDLLKDIEPEKLNKAYLTFAKWYEENKDYLVLSKDGFRWKLDKKAKERGVPNEPEYLLEPAAPFPELNKEQIPRMWDAYYHLDRMTLDNDSILRSDLQWRARGNGASGRP